MKVKDNKSLVAIRREMLHFVNFFSSVIFNNLIIGIIHVNEGLLRGLLLIEVYIHCNLTKSALCFPGFNMVSSL